MSNRIAIVAMALSVTCSFSYAQCPEDLRYLQGRFASKELQNPAIYTKKFSQTVAESGGLDRAIAASYAEQLQYERQRDQMKQSALSVAANPSQINQRCANPLGTFCELNNAYHMLREAASLAQEAVKGLECMKAGR